VVFPEFLVPDLRDHLDRFVGADPDALLFVGPRGGRPRRNNFHRLWHKARTRVGLPKVHLHDLRHTGSTLAVESGATLPELMRRMGHTTSRAALIYLHSRDQRDRQIADQLGKVAEQARHAYHRRAQSGSPQAAGQPATDKLAEEPNDLVRDSGGGAVT
jgi:integrase